MASIDGYPSFTPIHLTNPPECVVATPMANPPAPVASGDGLALSRLAKAGQLGGQRVEGWFISTFRRWFVHAPAPDARDPLGRAEASWQAIQRQFGTPIAKHVFADNTSNAGEIAAVWPFGQAIAATLDLARVTGDYRAVDSAMQGLQQYRLGQGYAPSYRPDSSEARYWDDNAWIGLDYMQAYKQTGDSQYLDKAKAMFPFMRQGLAPDGGTYWAERAKMPTRNTCANASAAEYALRLYQVTKDPQYLQVAENLNDFMQRSLRSPEGLYWDNLANNGSLDRSIYSYNQGAAIGMDVLFYRVTNDPKYLQQATQTAHAALQHFSQDDRLWKGAPSFNAILFRNLLALDAVAPDPAYRQTMNAYLDRVWTEARDPATGLFDKGGIGAYGPKGRGNLLDQSGLTQLFALSTWPSSDLPDIS
jgi:hypothetical protein